MKVTPVVNQTKFKPFAIQIEFETEEEAILLYDMLGYNVSIPEVMKLMDKAKKNRLTEIMSLIRKNISDQALNMQ